VTGRVSLRRFADEVEKHQPELGVDPSLRLCQGEIRMILMGRRN